MKFATLVEYQNKKNVKKWSVYNIITNLKKEFKKLFYTTKTASEIREELGLTYSEYNKLLQECKIDLGLPTSYKRKPSSFIKYSKYNYYILEYDIITEKYTINSYRPSLECAHNKLKELLAEKDNAFIEYTVEKATDKNLSELIEYEYYTKKNNWEDIIMRMKLPYHKFYELLNNLKKEKGDKNKTNRKNRFVYKYSPTKFVVKKNIHGKIVSFGYYDSQEDAMKIRDFLEENDWNVQLYHKLQLKNFEGVI